MRLILPLLGMMAIVTVVNAADDTVPDTHPGNQNLESRVSALEKKVGELQTELDATRRLIPQDADKLREQMKRETETTLGTKGEGQTAPEPHFKPRLGVILAPHSLELARKLKNDAKSGPFVVAVAAGSPADHAGIKAGDAVTSFNDKNIETVDELMNAVKAVPSGKVNVIVTRKGNQVGLTVDLSPREQAPDNTSYPDDRESVGG